MGTRRIRRRIGRPRNPLRRTSDRIQALLTFLVIMTVLMIAPWAGWWAGRTTYRDEMRAIAWERQHRFQVVAVLLEDADLPVGNPSDGVPPLTMQTSARWTGPGDVIHTGKVVAEVGKRAQSSMPIWIDEHGAVAAPPVGRHPVTGAVLAALLVVAGVAGGLTGMHRIAVWWLDRRRLRSWQAEWLVVEPQWSRK
jgi:hypothetical protein